MFEIDLDDYEKEVVRFLAKRFDRGCNWVGLTEFPRYEEVGQQEVYNVIGRFNNFGWLDSESSDSWTISFMILDVAHQLDHPRPKDYWAKWITWVRSKPWLIPFLVLAIVLPLLVQWVEMIKIVLRWVGILE